MARLVTRRSSRRNKALPPVHVATGFDADFLDFDPGFGDLGGAPGFAMGESQELNSQELVGAALYACDFLTGAAEPLPQLAELDEPQAADFPIPPAICLEEDPKLIASEIAMVHKIKNVKDYAAENGRNELYGEHNVSQWGNDLAHYRRLAMHQKGKLKPIIVTDADIRRLSYVPREHALRKGSASLARFRTAYCKLFDACDDRGSADAFLLFLRRKLNDKIEKHAQKQRKAETVRQMEKSEKKVVTENRFLRERVTRLEMQVVKKDKATAGPPVAGKRRSLRKIKSVPF